MYCIIRTMKKLLTTLLFAVLAVASTHAWAFCFKEAADRYQVDERLLRAIARTENAAYDPRLVIRDKDGWEYIGLMMISTIWLPELKKYGIDRERLMDPCINVNVGAWVLRDAQVRYGATWKSVGAFNTGKYSDDTAAQRRYITKVWRNFNKENR